MELGYRGSGDTLKREEFEARKKALKERNTHKTSSPKQLASSGKELQKVRDKEENKMVVVVVREGRDCSERGYCVIVSSYA